MSLFSALPNDFDELPCVNSGHVAKITANIPCTEFEPDQDLVVRKVIAIGAIYNKAMGFHYRDTGLLKHAVMHAHNAGLSISKTVRIGVANLYQGYDYNSEKHYAAELVVLCLIPIRGESDPKIAAQGRLVSPYGNGIETWQNLIKTRAPLMVVSSEGCENPEEITTWAICPLNYEKTAAVTLRGFEPAGAHRSYPTVARTIVRRDIAEALSMPPYCRPSQRTSDFMAEVGASLSIR